MMKKLFTLFILLIAVASNISAQYTASNSFIRKAIVIYEQDDIGFYHKSTDRIIDGSVIGIVKNYAYDKKAQNLYVLTNNGNFVVTLNKDYAKIIKKNSTIPQLKDEELQEVINGQTKSLEEKFERLNAERKQHIADSIYQAKKDSVAQAKKLAAQMEERNKAKQIYKNEHEYFKVPLLSSGSMKCTICDRYIDYDKAGFVFGIKNDSIYYASMEPGDLDITKAEVHASKIPHEIATNKDFLYHYEVFKDSLTKDNMDYQDYAGYLNYTNNVEYLNDIKKAAPYGYFDDWGWSSEYSMVTFHFRYTNTNAKTIKYITVFFKIDNGVGDVRKTGYFQGTGPLKEWETASWEWDSSSYFVSGDASNMSITKVVITYMNGTKQTVTGKYLRFN